MARSHRRMRSASLTTLPVIVEDETAIQPPPYTEQDGNWDDRHSTATESETAPTLVEKPETSRLPGWLHSRIGKRGGWKRFILIVAILFVLLTALGVGLGVGLSKARSQSRAENNTAIESEPDFPSGLWRFRTVLEVVRTTCTSEPDTFRCYPFTEYDQSGWDAEAMFDWIISPVNLKPNGHHDGYRIRSSDNPFSYSFGETALVEQRQGFPDDWYYGFNVTVNMLVSPTEPLNTTDGVAIGAVCEYQAVLSAKLYTARNATVPEGSDLSQDQNPRPWPFASDVELTAASGPAVPNCKGARNGVRLADDFSIASGYECTCTYTNDRERLDVL